MAHQSLDDLSTALQHAASQVVVGATYSHYKGGKYTVIDVVIDEASEAVCVLYRTCYEPHISFVRPLSSWLEVVDYNGTTVARFTQDF